MKILLYVTVVLVLNVLIINAGFLFNRTFTRFKDYRFRSEFFQSIQADLPWLGQVPIPLPYPYIEGLDWVRQNEQSAASYGNIYLLGHLSKPKGFPGYYFVAGLLKIPVASQIIILASLTLLFINRKHRKTLLQDGVFFLVPAAFFTIFYNFFYDTPIGIRHYLVMFPLLYVFARSLFNNWINWPRFWKGSSLILIAYLGVSVLSYFPYYIPYFNELVWNKTRRTNTCLTRILSGGKARMI